MRCRAPRFVQAMSASREKFLRVAEAKPADAGRGIVRLDPEVLELLADPTSGLAAEPSEAMLKGFDNECFELWRVKQNRER